MFAWEGVAEVLPCVFAIVSSFDMSNILDKKYSAYQLLAPWREYAL